MFAALPDAWAAYAGLFATAFVAATLLPAQSELLFGAMLVSGRFDTAALLAVATAGNTLGGLTNWVLGRSIERFRDRRWFPLGAAQLARVQRWYERWGKWSLLLSWVPIVGDGLPLIAGVMRAQLMTVLVLVFLAKGGRYLAIAGAARLLL